MLAGLLLAAEFAERQAALYRAQGEHLRMMCRPGDDLAYARADALAGLATSLRAQADREDTGEYVVLDLQPDGPPPVPSWWRRLLRW